MFNIESASKRITNLTFFLVQYTFKCTTYMYVTECLTYNWRTNKTFTNIKGYFAVVRPQHKMDHYYYLVIY